MKKIFYVETNSTYFVNNRLELACNMLNEGYEVHVATMQYSNDDRHIIENGGIKCHFQNNQKHSIRNIYEEIRKVDPDIIHVFTINASAKLGIFLLRHKKSKVLFSITGLGYAFISKSLYAKTIRVMLKILIPMLNAKHGLKFIFQNEDDKKIFINKYKLKPSQHFLILGSGVNLDKFYPSATTNNDVPKVLFVGRLLRDKGIYEFIEASKIICQREIPAKFIIAGFLDKRNPASLSEIDLQAIKKMPFFEYKGYVKDINLLLREVDIACLPSYREGLSKFLIEAGASGLPIITTNVPGCREVVENGKNGFIVPVKDSAALSEAIAILCSDKKKRERMGEASRMMIENFFSMDVVIKNIMNVYKSFC